MWIYKTKGGSTKIKEKIGKRETVSSCWEHLHSIPGNPETEIEILMFNKAIR